MPRTIRFHLDEHIDPAVADGLRRRHIEVTTAAEAGLLGADDAVQLSFASAHTAAVVTNDSDFLRFQQRGEQHCGIVYCHQQARTIGEIISALELIWEALEPNEMSNRVEFI